MSTRSNVVIRDHDELRQYYHHFDGYLEGVGHFLGNALVESLNADEDPLEYLLDQMRQEGDYEFEGNEFNPHADIEYLYFIDFQEDKVQIGVSYRSPGDAIINQLPTVDDPENFIDLVNSAVRRVEGPEYVIQY